MDDRTRIEIYRDKRNLWRWRFQDGTGKILATSSASYQERVDCENSLAVIFGSMKLGGGRGDRMVAVNRKYDTIPVDHL